MRRTSFRFIRIQCPAGPALARLAVSRRIQPHAVALGRGGIKASKREGDGGTPAGRFHPVRLWWRPDRLPRPRTLLPVRRIGRQRCLVRGPDGPPL